MLYPSPAISLDKATVSGVITHFIDALNMNRNMFIKFPVTVDEKNVVKKGFYQIGENPDTHPL